MGALCLHIQTDKDNKTSGIMATKLSTVECILGTYGHSSAYPKGPLLTDNCTSAQPLNDLDIEIALTLGDKMYSSKKHSSLVGARTHILCRNRLPKHD
jgi:hypothetical protein